MPVTSPAKIERLALPFDISKVIDLCRQNDVVQVSLFGSMARGEATDKSDIDLIVRFASRKSLLAVANLAIQIEDATGRKVDLLTERSISPHIRERVKKDLRVVYELG